MSDLDAGLLLRDEGMALAEEAAHEELKMEFRSEASRLASLGVVFTSEDITETVGLPRGSVGTNQNNAVGAMMNGLSRYGRIKRVGSRLSRRPGSHAAELAEWIGVEWADPTDVFVRKVEKLRDLVRQAEERGWDSLPLSKVRQVIEWREKGTVNG